MWGFFKRWFRPESKPRTRGILVSCQVCKGTGKRGDRSCTLCLGTGQTSLRIDKAVKRSLRRHE